MVMQGQMPLPEPKSPYLEALRWVEIQRQSGVKICFTNGVYDILTAGHIQFLEWLDGMMKPSEFEPWALVVGINSDESVQANKGRHRPINPLEDRLAVMNALWMPDLVVPFFEATPAVLISTIQPDMLAKGGDYKGQPVVGMEVVQARHGRVLYGPYLEGRSTSKTIERVYRATHGCPACAGRGIAVGSGEFFDSSNPHDQTCSLCSGRGYV